MTPNRWQTVGALVGALFLVGCSKNNTASPAPPPSATPTPTPVLSVSPSPTVGSTASATGTPTGTPTATATVQVTVLSNQTISGHPHAIDFYRPANATSAIVFLHGGGGKKEGFANSLGIKNDDLSTDYDLSPSGRDWLVQSKVLAVFPQGQALASNPGATTWNNDVMLSGVDDVAFLQDLVASLKADPAFADIHKFYLAGHSNGGMMTNRMWCESPTTFDAYGSLAGPMSSHLEPSVGSSPCAPSVVKPYLAIVGDSDTVLRTTGNMAVTYWYGNPALVALGAAAWVDPAVYPRYLNEVLFYGKRTALGCSGTPAAPVVSGQLETYSDCSGALRLIVVHQATDGSGGDHCIGSLSGPCVTTLVGNTGLDPKNVLFDFFKNF